MLSNINTRIYNNKGNVDVNYVVEAHTALVSGLTKSINKNNWNAAIGRNFWKSNTKFLEKWFIEYKSLFDMYDVDDYHGWTIKFLKGQYYYDNDTMNLIDDNYSNYLEWIEQQKEWEENLNKKIIKYGIKMLGRQYCIDNNFSTWAPRTIERFKMRNLWQIKRIVWDSDEYKDFLKNSNSFYYDKNQKLIKIAIEEGPKAKNKEHWRELVEARLPEVPIDMPSRPKNKNTGSGLASLTKDGVKKFNLSKIRSDTEGFNYKETEKESWMIQTPEQKEEIAKIVSELAYKAQSAAGKKYYADPKNIKILEARRKTKEYKESMKKVGESLSKPCITPYGKFKSNAAFMRHLPGVGLHGKRDVMPHLYYYEEDGLGKPTYEDVYYTPYGYSTVQKNLFYHSLKQGCPIAKKYDDASKGTAIGKWKDECFVKGSKDYYVKSEKRREWYLDKYAKLANHGKNGYNAKRAKIKPLKEVG